MHRTRIQSLVTVIGLTASLFIAPMAQADASSATISFSPADLGMVTQGQTIDSPIFITAGTTPICKADVYVTVNSIGLTYTGITNESPFSTDMGTTETDGDVHLVRATTSSAPNNGEFCIKNQTAPLAVLHFTVTGKLTGTLYATIQSASLKDQYWNNASSANARQSMYVPASAQSTTTPPSTQSGSTSSTPNSTSSINSSSNSSKSATSATPSKPAATGSTGQTTTASGATATATPKTDGSTPIALAATNDTVGRSSGVVSLGLGLILLLLLAFGVLRRDWLKQRFATASKAKPKSKAKTVRKRK